jgi:hypothetical protein
MVLGLTNAYKNTFISNQAFVSSLTCSLLFISEYRMYIINHCINRGSCITLKVVDSNVIFIFLLERPST